MTINFQSYISVLRARVSKSFITGFNYFLFACIVINLIIKYVLSQDISLTSDSAIAGIVSREIWIHHNFLANFCFPVADPFLFTDIIPFHFPLQILTHFNPVSLKIAAFIAFCLIICIFGFLVYKITESWTSSLVFAALLSAISPDVFLSTFAVPTSHITTIIFVGFLFIVLYDFPQVHYGKMVVSLVLVAIITFSDSLFVLWFLIPGLLYYVYYYSRKKFQGWQWMLLLLVTSGVVLFVKVKYLPALQQGYQDYQVNTWDIVQTNGIAFLNDIVSMYNTSFYHLGQNFNYPAMSFYLSAITALMVFVFFVVMLYLDSRDPGLTHSKKASGVLTFTIFVGLTMFFFFVFLHMARADGILRYVTFFGVLLFLVIAVIYRNEKIFTVLIIFCLSGGMVSNFVFIAPAANDNPNQSEYELIGYLASQNLHFGFSGYWDSNIITYLSNESIIVRPAYVYNAELYPAYLDTDKLWYYNISSVHPYFILVKKNETSIQQIGNSDMVEYTQYHTPSKILHFETYTIYVFDNEPLVLMSSTPVYYHIGQLSIDNTTGSATITVLRSDGEGLALYGPYQQFPEGNYTVQFTLSSLNSTIQDSNSPFAKLNVATDLGKTIIAEKELYPENITQINKTSLEFSLTQSKILEFQVWSEGNMSFKVDAFPVVKKDNEWF